MVADGHMPNLVAQDHIEDFTGPSVPGADQLGLDRWRSVQSSRLKGTRDQCNARKDVALGLLRHLPQRVVSREVAVGKTHRTKVVAQKLKVQRLLLGHANPLPIKLVRHPCKSPTQVQGQVDGIQLDVGQCVDQCSPPFDSRHRPRFERRVINQNGPIRSTRHAHWFNKFVISANGATAPPEDTCQRSLLVRVAAGQWHQRLNSKGRHGP